MEKFHFKGFDPVDSVRTKANSTYERVLEAAPSDAKVTAVLEWEEGVYRCSFEIGSLVWPAAVSVTHLEPLLAIEKAERAILAKVEKWKQFRFTPLQGFSRELAEASA